MLVLGCVREIHTHHVLVMLPGGISAQLPITSISPTYTQAVQEFTEQNIAEEVSIMFFVFEYKNLQILDF